MTAYERIYQIVRQIPVGQVATYGQIAELANMPGQARLVGYALYRVVETDEVPWHRVINAKGEVSHSPFREGSDYLQQELMEQEGVKFNQKNKIKLSEYQWRPEWSVSERGVVLHSQQETHAEADVTD